MQKIRKHIFLLLLCFLPLSVNALTLDEWRQQLNETRQLADSDPEMAQTQAQRLLNLLPIAADPHDQIHAINVIARTEVYMAQMEQANKHAQKALNLAKQYQDQVGQVEALMNIVINAVNQGDIDASVSAAIESIGLLDGIQRPDILAEAMLRTSMSYSRVGLLDDAVSLALQSMEIVRQENDPLALMYASQALALVQIQGGQEQQAYYYYQQMQLYARQSQAKLWETHASLEMAEILMHSGNEEEAEPLFIDAINQFREMKFPFSLTLALYRYAYFLSEQKRYLEANRLIQEEMEIYQKYHNDLGYWYALNAYADNLLQLNQHKEADQFVRKAYQLAQKVGFPWYMEESARRLAALLAKAGNYQQAYHYIDQAEKWAKEYAKKKSSSRIVSLTERYKLESKQRQIDKLNLQTDRQEAKLRQQELEHRLLWILVISGGVLFLGTLLFMFKLHGSNQNLSRLNSEVKQSKNKLQATLNAIPDSLFIVDENGILLEIHTPDRGSDLPWLSPNMIIGKGIDELFTIDGDVDQWFHSVVQGQFKQNTKLIEAQIELIGHEYWFELSIARKKTDAREKFIILARDISERKRMEETLYEREQELRTLVEHSPDGIVRYDREGRRIYVNTFVLNLFGVDSSTLIGKTMDEWSYSNNYGEYNELVEQVLKTGKEARMIMQIATSSSGRNVYGDVRFVPEFDVNHEVVSVLAVSRDITQLKEAEQQIEEAYTELRALSERREAELEEERKRIARDMHDELGQYLTSLRMSISVLKMKSDAKDKSLQSQFQFMLSLLDKTLYVIRNIVLQLRPAQLEMGVMAALEWLVEDFIKANQIPCELVSELDDMEMSDHIATAIFRIVQESLTNIVRYAQAKTVKITLKVDEHNYFLTVQDDGIGFDMQKMKKNSFGVLGMKERARHLGGVLNLSSEQGKGTTIEVTLPMEMSMEKTID